MSVNPNKKGPFTESERAYLSNHTWGKQAIEKNEREYGEHAASAEQGNDDHKELSIVDPDSKEKVSLSADTFEKVKAMGLDEVKGTLQSLQLSPEGSEGEVRARLAVHLESK